MTLPDWLEFALVLLPLVLLLGCSALPLALGLVVTARHRRQQDGPAYLLTLAGSTAAGLISFNLLAGALFGSALSASSTSALIFVVTPVWSGLAFGAAYYVVRRILHGRPPVRLSNAARGAIALPVLLLVVLAAGMTRYAAEHGAGAVAQRATRPTLLAWAYERAVHDAALRPGVTLFLAENRNTPTEILVALQADASAVIRAKVAAHANTPADVVERLSHDSSERVRDAARRRLER